MEHNQQEIDKRKGTLEQAGGFRTLVHAPKLGRRVYKNVWSERVHRLSGFDETGAHAKGEEGKLFLTKELLPAPPPSQIARRPCGAWPRRSRRPQATGGRRQSLRG